MKKDIILINTTYSGIINEEDLVRALSKSYLWGASLDCYEQELSIAEKYANIEEPECYQYAVYWSGDLKSTICK